MKYSEPNEYYKALKRIESSGYEYVVTNESEKCATITKIKNYTDKIVIPQEIDGYKVTGIGIPYDDENDYELLSKEDAMTIYGENRDNMNGVNYIRRCIMDYNDEKVSSIEIPEGITRISSGAFGNLKALKELKLPKSLTYIDNRNFLECVNLSELTVKGTLFVKNSFRGAGFDTITVYGDLICGDDEAIIGIDGKVKKLILKPDSFNSSAKSKTRVLTLYDLNVGELIIPKNTNGITEINTETANIARITTANHNIKFTGRVNEKISSETKAKSKFNKKTKKYTFTCKKINYNSTNDGRYSVENKTCKDIMYQKNKKGKYVKVKTTSVPKYITNKKAAVKVKCELNISRKNILIFM